MNKVNRMSGKIYKSIIFAVGIILTASVALIMGILYEFFESRLQKDLCDKALYISYALESGGADYLCNFDKNDERITLIAADGRVIYDTKADPSALESHADRAEVIEAKKSGSGSSTRYSSTLMEKTVYYAKKLDNGDILRVSATEYTVLALFLGILQPVLAIIAAALIVSFIISDKVAKKIVAPINELNLEQPERNDTYEELTPLLSKLSSQRRIIDAQIKSAANKQEEFKLITENMSEGFLVIDRDTSVLTYNSSALKLLGITSEVKGSVLKLNRTKEFREAVTAALAGEKSENEMTVSCRSYRLIASPVYENEKVIGAVIIILDNTESVERERLRREFTSNVSHELKTPLTSISGFAEVLKSGGVPQETALDFAGSIYDEAQRLITLVGDIIKISELDEGTVKFEKENVDIYEISQSISERLKAEAAKHKIKVTVSGDSAYVFGVKRILEEMIYNLADNAIKYNKEGGTVDINVLSKDDRVLLSVKDTGIGIPPSSLDRVFERFYRVDKSRSRQIGGTGLGLSIVKHGAIYHGARLSIDSTEGEGTAVTIEFIKEQTAE